MNYDIFTTAGLEITDEQKQAAHGIADILCQNAVLRRALLYFSTGEGKTRTSLQAVKIALPRLNVPITTILVVAPPSTHPEWKKLVSAHFTQESIVVSPQWLSKNIKTAAPKINKGTIVIWDEFHQSANRGKVLTKLATNVFKACYASILASATPFRNKEERLHTVHGWLFGNAGSYEDWLSRFCVTEPDRFAYYPKFLRFKVDDGSAEAFLKSIDDGELKKVFIIKNELKYKKTFKFFPIINSKLSVLDEYSVYGTENIQVANSVRQKLAYGNYLKFCDSIDRNEKGDIVLSGARQDISEYLLGQAERRPIVYCYSSKISRLYHEAFRSPSLLVDGKTIKKKKEEIISQYKLGDHVLFATDSVSTGTDGLQTVTDLIIILDDTQDGTNREQLIGRIAGGFRNNGNAEIVFVTIA